MQTVSQTDCKHSSLWIVAIYIVRPFSDAAVSLLCLVQYYHN